MESKKIKARQLKDDAILNIKVNKTFYLMCKSSLFYTFKKIYTDTEKSSEEFVKAIVSKKYEEMNDEERLFYALTLLVGEIEKQGVETESFIEKDFTEEDLLKEMQEKSSED